MIRPVIQALIQRGHVQIDEVAPLNCNQQEATALIPALANIALSQRIARCIANTPKWAPEDPGFQLRSLAAEAKLRLEAVPFGLPQYSNAELADHISIAAHNPGYPQPGTPDYKGYIELLRMLSLNAAQRLKGGF